MRYRKLGKTNWEVSEIGYGAWGIGGKQWLGGNDDESVNALRRAIDLGLNFIDTALAYGDGHSERLVGQVVRDTSKKIYVATKVPPKNRLWPARPGIPISEVFPYNYIMECAAESHENLKLPIIDLLQLHVWNPEWIDDDGWRRALSDLKTSGKVAAVGISINDHDPDSALSIIRTGLIDTVQVIFNVFDQTPERNLFPLCQAENIGVLARVPLDEGSLGGHITPETTFPEGDFRNFYFRDDRKQQVFDRVNALKSDLGDGTSLPDTALRFCLSHPAVTSVIPGMRSVRHAESNVGLSDQGALPAETMSILRRHAWDRNFYS